MDKIRKLDDATILSNIEDLKKELFNLRFQAAVGKLENTERGGGIVFGPTPRSYAVKCNKKAVKLAKKCLLSNKLALNKLVVVDALNMEGFKTKDFAKILGNLNASGKIVVALDSENTNVTIASNNIPNVYVQNYSHLSVYDMINADMYILTEATVKKYEEELK